MLAMDFGAAPELYLYSQADRICEAEELLQLVGSRRAR